MMPWYAYVVLGLAALALIGLAAWAQVRQWHNQRKDARDKARLAALAQGADNPEIDEDFARQVKE